MSSVLGLWKQLKSLSSLKQKVESTDIKTESGQRVGSGKKALYAPARDGFGIKASPNIQSPNLYGKVVNPNGKAPSPLADDLG
jgi:hypothetical protein